MQALVPLCRLHHRLMASLLQVRCLTTPARKTDVGAEEGRQGGGKEAAAPSAGSAGGGAEGVSGLLPPVNGATPEPQPSDPLDEAREERFERGEGRGAASTSFGGLLWECIDAGERGYELLTSDRVGCARPPGGRAGWLSRRPSYSLMCSLPSSLAPSFAFAPSRPFLRPLCVSSFCSRLPAPRPAPPSKVDRRGATVRAGPQLLLSQVGEARRAVGADVGAQEEQGGSPGAASGRRLCHVRAGLEAIWAHSVCAGPSRLLDAGSLPPFRIRPSVWPTRGVASDMYGAGGVREPGSWSDLWGWYKHGWRIFNRGPRSMRLHSLFCFCRVAALAVSRTSWRPFPA